MELNNAIIRASAGSGKTYALVQRYLRLLALSEPPESIVAMTFTRKSAREFFERILQKLAELAADPASATGYVDELAVPGRALALLRSMIRSMDRLKLGTIDGFFASIARCFPFELGLAGQASVMAEAETQQARSQVMHALLVEVTRDPESTALSEMLEAWKRATAGNELNRPSEYLDGWFTRLHGLYMESPAQAAWGNSEVIWPDKSMPVWMADDDIKQAVDTLRDCLDLNLYGKGADAKWEEFYADAIDRRAGEPIKGALEYMLKKDRGDFRLLREGRAIWMMNKSKPVLSAKTGGALADVLDIVVGKELQCRSLRTQGRRDVVARFDKHYANLIRSRGRLAFADLTWLLAGKIQALSNGQGLERWDAMRADWEYRLDSRFRHWLFDEFQDTSRRQWDVVANLVDEAASDPEGRRSFFAVGDLKQSLYLWRQAEPELFLKVEAHYANTRMEKPAPLVTSFRSSKHVLSMVNAVFQSTDILIQTYPDAMRWWSFDEHKASPQNAGMTGHAALVLVPAESDVDEETARDEIVAGILRHVAPLDRGLSCAVLTRSNVEAQRVSSELRKLLQVEVVCESEVPVALDNPVTLALLSIFQLAVHPGDSYAEQHLRMSPLSKWFEMGGNTGLLGNSVRREVAEKGFLSTARTWSDELRNGVGEWDAFSAWRLGQFLDLAAEFDQSGSQDVDAFIEFARKTTMRATEQGRALQVMTVHKSKGLEFDVVIMPHIERTAMDQGRPDSESLLSQRGEDGEIEWLLDKPPSLLCERDERLSEAVRQDKAKLAYQGLCRLYVGMTRAKRALYLVLPPKGNARSEVSLLKETLITEKPAEWGFGDVVADCGFELGQRDWFLAAPIKEELAAVTEAAPQDKLGALLKHIMEPVRRTTPSAEEAHIIKGQDLLSPQREHSRHMGTLVHELFEAIDWLDGRTTADIEAAWNAKGLHQKAGYEDARVVVQRTLAAAEVAPWFSNAAQSRVVWMERSFDMLYKDQWISGVLDRVVLERNGAGDWTGATILDFKTDKVADEAAMKDRAAGYAPQMKLYKEAVSRLTGLNLDTLKAGLIFTVMGKVAWV